METGFGWITIKGTRYENDVVVHADGDVTKRKKKLSKDLKASYGHTPLSAKELDFLSEERPEVVVIGTGQYGNLPITPDAQELLDRYESIVLPTPQAIEVIEKEDRKLVALLHVTC